MQGIYGLGRQAARVYRELHAAIEAGELARGTKLPAFPVLARQFGVAPMTIRQALLRLDAEGLVERRHGVGTFVRRSEAVAAADLAARYLAALLAGDRDAAVRVALEEGLARGLAVPDLYLGVIQPAQARIGDLWQENRLTVAQEHLATAIAQLVLALAYPALPRAPSNGKRVLVACAEDELHDLGARMAADFFEMAGFDVRYLGANLPTDSLVGMVREDPPDLVALSVTMAFHLDAARAVVRQLREGAGDRMHVALGGQAFTWAADLPAQFGADVYAGSIVDALASARCVLGLEAVA
jgi:methanogenic corrinoid protein MtbC1